MFVSTVSKLILCLSVTCNQLVSYCGQVKLPTNLFVHISNQCLSVFAFGQSYPVLFAARALQGLGSACSSVSGKYPNKRKTKLTKMPLW